MPNPAANEARALSDDDLATAINEAYRELFTLQFQKGTHQLTNTMAIPQARHQVARLRTIRQERARGVLVAPLATPAERQISPQKRRAQEERERVEAEAAAAETESTESESTESESAESESAESAEPAVAAAPAEEPAAETESAESESAESAEPAVAAAPAEEPAADDEAAGDAEQKEAG